MTSPQRPKVRASVETSLLMQPAAAAVLREWGFPVPRRVPATGSLRGLLPSSWTCGLYVLECEDGEIYVGKTAVHVQSRLNSHRKVMPCITAITFVRMARRELDESERRLHGELQAVGHRLKNITFSRLEVMPSGRFADVLSEEDQAEWLHSGMGNSDQGERSVTDEQRRQGQRQFELFSTRTARAWMVPLIHNYIWETVPVPLQTERVYWSVTLKTRADGYSFIRLNVGAQTTLDLHADEGGGSLVVLYTPRNRFERAFGVTLPAREELERMSSEQRAARSVAGLNDAIFVEPSALVEAGADQYYIKGTVVHMKELLETEFWIAEARPMHLDMMQRRKNINGRSHNVSLADVVLDEGVIEAYLSDA